jgi:hypothetical protein
MSFVFRYCSSYNRSVDLVTWLVTVGLYRRNTLHMFMFGNINGESCHLCVCCCACNIVLWGRFAVVCSELLTAKTSSFILCACITYQSWSTIKCIHVCITCTQLSLEITSVRVVFNSLKRNFKADIPVARCAVRRVFTVPCPFLLLGITRGPLGPAALSDGTQLYPVDRPNQLHQALTRHFNTSLVQQLNSGVQGSEC